MRYIDALKLNGVQVPVHVIVPMLKKPGSVIADEVPKLKEASR